MSRGEFNRDMDDYLRRRKVSERTNPLLAAKQFFTKNFTFGTVKKAEPEQLSQDVPQDQIDAVLSGQGVPKAAARVTMTRPASMPGAGAGARTTQTQRMPAQPLKAAPAQQKESTTMGWFTKKKEQDEDYDMAELAPATPVIDEEVKEVLKITFKWLKMMDAETVEEIKNSPDFEKYKAVLGKYGLIKK